MAKITGSCRKSTRYDKNSIVCKINNGRFLLFKPTTIFNNRWRVARSEILKAIEYKEWKRDSSFQLPISGRSAVLPETAGGLSARHSFFLFQVTNDFFVTNEFVAIYILWKKIGFLRWWQGIINMCSNFDRKWFKTVAVLWK